MKFQEASFIVLSCAFLCACSSAPTPNTIAPTGEDTADTSSEALAIEFRPVKIADGSEVAFSSGDTLRSGDAFAYYVRTTRDAHVYVLQFFPDGTRSIIHEQKAQANAEARIPSDGDLVLDEHVGEEHVYIIATLEPVSPGSSPISDLVQEAKQSPRGSAEVPDPSRPPTEDSNPVEPQPAPEPNPSAGKPAPRPAPKAYAQIRPNTQLRMAMDRHASPMERDRHAKGIVKRQRVYRAEANEDIVVTLFSFKHAARE